MKYRYFAVNKPYGVLSQFTEESGHPGLGSLFAFPPDVYPVGRLDRDSEGLLILTDNKAVNEKLLHPKYQREKTYWAQVEKIPSSEALLKLRKGVKFKAKGKEFVSAPCQAKLINPQIKERIPPIRERKNIPTAWIELSISEGKNRQIRKMCSAIGHPCLRLIRVSIKDLTLDFEGVKELNESEFFRLLKL